MDGLLILLNASVAVLIIIAAILLFLLPFFVFRIRNEVIKMNKKLDSILNALTIQLPEEDRSIVKPT